MDDVGDGERVIGRARECRTVREDDQRFVVGVLASVLDKDV